MGDIGWFEIAASKGDILEPLWYAFFALFGFLRKPSIFIDMFLNDYVSFSILYFVVSGFFLIFPVFFLKKLSFRRSIVVICFGFIFVSILRFGLNYFEREAQNTILIAVFFALIFTSFLLVAGEIFLWAAIRVPSEDIRFESANNRPTVSELDLLNRRNGKVRNIDLLAHDGKTSEVNPLSSFLPKEENLIVSVTSKIVSVTSKTAKPRP